MRVPHNGIVLVADGRKMLFFRNEGDGEFRYRSSASASTTILRSNEGSDVAGRTFSSAGSPRGGSAVSAGAHNQRL